jgi:valyl-tRNA synthetase
MSKSFRNVLDPLELVDRYGADAVRLALVQAAAPGHDIPLDEQWVDAARRFGNKLWNALRFAVAHVGITGVPVEGGYPSDPGPEDAWILQRLGEVAAEFDDLMEGHRLSDAYGLLYNFAWSEVFDWYVELAKTPLKDDDRSEPTAATLGVVLRDLLKLFHPLIPFVTEELWSHLGADGLLITAPWPEPATFEGPASMETFQALVTEIRRFRSDHDISQRTPIEATIHDPTGVVEPWWEQQLQSLVSVAIESGAPPDGPGTSRIAAGSVEMFIPTEGLIDVAAERARLEKARSETDEQLDRARRKLANPDFIERAPENVVAKERGKVEEFEARLAKLEGQLAELG